MGGKEGEGVVGEVRAGDPGKWPAPCWALPVHGGNTEEAIDTLLLRWIIYWRETIKRRSAKPLSMFCLAQSEKAIVASEI